VIIVQRATILRIISSIVLNLKTALLGNLGSKEN
jgi:hypothetical protein